DAQGQRRSEMTATLWSGSPAIVKSAVSWLLTYAVHSTLLLSAVWLVCKQLRDRALWLQESLWKMALVGGLLTATVQMAEGVQPLGGLIPLGAIAEVPQSAATHAPASGASSPLPLGERLGEGSPALASSPHLSSPPRGEGFGSQNKTPALATTGVRLGLLSG